MNNNNVKKYDESYSCKVIYVKLYAKKDVDQKRDGSVKKFVFLVKNGSFLVRIQI